MGEWRLVQAARYVVMARQSFIWCPVEKRLVPKTDQQRGATAPFIISDTIDPTWHPADGRKYDSKSRFRRTTKAAGCTEVGNERQTDRRQIDRVSKSDIARAMEMVRQGYRPRITDRLD